MTKIPSTPELTVIVIELAILIGAVIFFHLHQ